MDRITFGPGLYSSISIPHGLYHADPCDRPSLSAHIAKELVRHSPGHAARMHPRLGGQYTKKASAEMDVGTVIHGLLLGSGPEIVEVNADDWRTKAAQQSRSEAEASGKVAMLSRKLAKVKTAADKIRVCLPFDLAASRNEVTAIWDSGAAICRARIDSLHPDWWIWDLKIVDDAMLSSADRNVVSFDYHVQAASNLDGIETLAPEAAGRARFGLCFVEWENPEIGIKRCEIRGQLLDVGKQRWDRAKSVWPRCLMSGQWPGYSSDITEVKCPAWAAGEEFEQQIAANVAAPF